MTVVVCYLLLALAIAISATRAAGPLVIAHRGASSDAPENTLAAFRLAWEQGADGIEGDFRLTADGRVVCIHDSDTKRVAGHALVVRDATYDDLRTLDVGAWQGETWRGEKIPSLEEVLALVPAGKMLQIELKTGPEIVAPLADAIERSAIDSKQLLLIAFDADAIAACKQRMPQIKCHWLTNYKQQASGNWSPTPGEVIATIRRIGADGFGSASRPEVFDEAFVRQLRTAGIDEFHVWTVDDPEVARFYRRLGAWGLTTNRPEKLRAELAL
jgi:glycerophosphoryl diester phosphodiesterase